MGPGAGSYGGKPGRDAVRALVVGSYPPAASTSAADNLAVVADLLASGHDVEVLSPAPSAAHHHAPLHRIWGPLILARHARSFDALVLRCEVALVFPPGAGRIGRVARCAAYGLVLRWGPPATVHLAQVDTPGFVAVRSGRLLWRHARRLVVATEEDRLRIAHQSPFPLDRIDVRSPPPKMRPPRPATGGDPERARILETIRAQAAADRRAEEDQGGASET